MGWGEIPNLPGWRKEQPVGSFLPTGCFTLIITLTIDNDYTALFDCRCSVVPRARVEPGSAYCERGNLDLRCGERISGLPKRIRHRLVSKPVAQQHCAQHC